MKKVIINADDFGYSLVFNEKILDLLKRNCVKSTTVLINKVNAAQLDQIRQLVNLKENGNVSVGLHLELNPKEDASSQIRQQLDKFKSIFGSEPSHLDVHKLSGNKDLMPTVNKFAETSKLPVRNTGIPTKTKQTTLPAYYDGWPINLQKIQAFLETVKEGESCEIITHPGDYDPNCPSTLNKERREDYEVIIKLQDHLTKLGMKNSSYLEI